MHISGYECQMNGSLVPVSVRLCSLANMEPCSITNKYMVFFLWLVRKQSPREYVNVSMTGISSKSGFLTVIGTCDLFFSMFGDKDPLITNNVVYSMCSY